MLLKIKKWGYRIIALLCVSSMLVTQSTPVSATSYNQYKTEINSFFYEEHSGLPATCTTGSAGALAGRNNEEKAFRFLTAKGLTPTQAAGIVGNLVKESGVTPDNQEDSKPFPSGGWGIAQWTNGRRTTLVDALTKAGLPYTNEATPPDKMEDLLVFELNFLWSEATDRGDIAKVQNETTVQGAAQAWLDNFEIAGVKATQERINEGDRILQEYGGGVTGSGSGTTTNCSGGIASGNFTYYSQYDPAWANQPYGASGKSILSSGCGPTSTAMVIATLKDKSVTPQTIASWGAKYYVEGQGSSHQLFLDAAAHWGLKAKSIGTNEQLVKDTLNSGGLVIAGGSGADPFTSSGHIIVIRNVTPEGKYLVGNPLPDPADQGKSSTEVAKDTSWMEKQYTWAQLSTNSTGMYAITK